MINRIYPIVIILFLISGILHAEGPSKKDLQKFLQQNERPSLKEAIPFFPLISNDLSEFSGLGGHGQEGNLNIFLWEMMYDAPRFIAIIEKQFPGAKFAFVGRDVFPLADMLEAFYLSIGQVDRVVRLGVSKGSFTDNSQSPPKNGKEFMSFLRGHGFSWSKIENKGLPFIFVDTVSSGGGRQGRGLLDVIYKDWTKKGKKAYDLLPLVNMVGLTVSTFSGSINAVENAENHLQKERSRYKNDKIIKNFYDEHQILQFKGLSVNFGESGYDHFVNSWHGSYGELYRDTKKRKTLAVKGEQSPVEYKMNVLKYQKAIVQNVFTTAFKKRVAFFADQLGYEFPMSRMTEVKLKTKKSFKLKKANNILNSMDKGSVQIRALNQAAAANIIQEFSELQKENEVESIKKLSANGQLVRRLIRGSNFCQGCNPSLLVEQIVKSYNANKLSDVDLKLLYLYMQKKIVNSRQLFEAIFYNAKYRSLIIAESFGEFNKKYKKDYVMERHVNNVTLYHELKKSGHVFCQGIFSNAAI